MKDIGKGYLDNYMSSQGIDMDNPPTSFGQGLQQVAKKYTGYNEEYDTGGAGGFAKGLLRGYAEKQAKEDRPKPAPMLMAAAPDVGKLSDFIGTIQTSERRKQQNRPF
ncbi:MAG: hypothetical protein JRE40_12595 [Deltaproteobacteria bacterium]|nr:hypothetical protein [Deltaproteobacteria bacterium]